MTPVTDMVPPAGLDEFLARHGWTDAQISPVAGDASFRRYFRVLRATAAVRHAVERLAHPERTFAARRALAAAFVLVELRQAPDRLDDIGRLIHHDHRRRAKARLRAAQPIEIHDRIFALRCVQHRHGRPTGDHRLDILPPTANATTVTLQQIFQWDRHCFFNHTRVVHMARDTEQLGARIVGATKGGEPIRPAPQDRWHNGDGFDIVHRRRTSVQTRTRRERRLHPGHALLAFKAFQQGGLFAADIGAGAMVDDDVEVPAVDVVLADEARLIGLVEGTRTVIELPAGEAFGDHNPDMQQWVARKLLNELGDPMEKYAAGDVVQFPTPDGMGTYAGTVLQVGDDGAVLFDFNHPLAGQPVTFEVQLIGVL